MQLEKKSAGDLVKYCELFYMWAFWLQWYIIMQLTVEDVPALA